MILGYKTKNDRKIEELEKVIKKYVEKTDLLQGEANTLKKEKITASQKHNVLSSQFEDEVKYTKERFIEYIDERTVLYTGLHDRLVEIESIGDFVVLMKRLKRVEEQFGPILGKVTDTFSGAMQTLISEAAKTNQHIAGMAKNEINKAFTIERPNDFVSIMVNGVVVGVKNEPMTYQQLVKMDNYNHGENPSIMFTGGGDPERPGGILSGTNPLIIKEGTVISIADTEGA